MQAIWQRIEQWLAQNAPDAASALQPGASDETLKQAQKELRCTFPEQVRASYQIHDGMRTGSLIDQWQLMPLDSVVREWKLQKELLDDGTFANIESEADVQIKPVWWNLRWIPLLSDGAGDFICVDLDPEGIGDSGQIIEFLHASPQRELLAKDFQTYMAQVADRLNPPQ